MDDPNFPLWLRATHLINFVLIGILLRSGWEMLSSLPRLWWRNDSKPGTEWLRFTRQRLPQEEGVYTSLMDERSLSPLIGLPGRKNIGLGRPSATTDEIIAAAKAVGAHEFIEQLPDGYDTDVNKRGGRVSAGQRQLVSFARAFLADPAVLILDEATASLDIPSERAIQDALQTLLADRTAIIIAHRLSTVEIADRVLVMEYGEIIEDDSPEALKQGAGKFAQLHKAWQDSLV